VEDNFLMQLVSEPTRGDALLDQLFTRRAKWSRKAELSSGKQF